MFKRFNLQEEVSKDKYILMKNSREEFCEIDKGYIKNIHYSWHDLNSIDIEVPYHISVDGVKKIEPLYDKFLGKRQYITVNDNEKYVVTQCERNEDYTGKKIKTIKAESSEITLNDFDFYIGTGGLVRKLYKVDNDVDISEGVLDLCLAETGWKVKTVSDKARLEMNKMSEIYYKDLYKPLQKDNITKGMVLWEQNFDDLNPITDNVISVNIAYKNIKSYINGQLQKDETMTHQLGSYSSGIKKIKAIYDGNDEYRYAIKYEITLADNTTPLERWYNFTYLDGMNITVEDILMNYTNGTEVEKSYIKVRRFDEGTYKVYDFLKNEIEKAFGVKILFDTFNKEISCYTYDEIGEDTSLFLSYENFIKNINKKSQYDEIVTKLYVESEKADISEENPTGLNYILDFTYFKENGLMSDELAEAYDRYLATLEGKQEQIVNKRIDLNTLNKKKIKLDTDRKTLEERIKGLQSIWNAYVKENAISDANRIATEINELQTKHSENLRDTENVRQQINALKEEMEKLVKTVSIEVATDNQGKIFSDILLDEMRDITITDTLADDYYTTPYSLYKYAVDVLSKKNKLPIEFDVDITGLLQNMIIPDGHTFDDILTLGNFVNINDKDIDNGKIRLISFDYSPSDFKVSNFKFSNNDEDFSDLNKLSNIGRTINKNATYTNNYKTSWVAGKNVNDFVNSMLTDYLDTKTVNIRSRQGRNKYDMSESGLYVIDALNENSQIYIGSGMICITENGWLTTKTCVDGSGIYADVIVGKLIAGKNLAIGNENNTMTIDEDGIQIEGNIFKVKGTDGTNRDFNSYITMLNNQIIAGVQDSKNHTDAQFKILGDRIVAGVQDSKNHTDAQFQILGNEISTKVAKGQDFHTEFSQTASEFNFTIGRDGAVVINKDGIEVTFNNNQGKAKMGKDGFYWQKDSLSKAYHSLTYKGEIFTSPDVQVGNLVTLPEEFRGKDFEVIVSPKNVKREGAYTLYWLNCYYSGRNPSNGTFKVHGNADWRSSADGSLAGSTGITVTYVVLA